MLFAQDYIDQYNIRAIVFNYPDSLVKVNVLISEEEFKIKDELKYYWYNNDIIGCNRGGVHGKPLHGEYTICNIDGNLLVQGNFEHGLKHGKWKYWYVNGEIKRAENWKEGLKDDIQKYYSESGEIVKELRYKKNKEIEAKEKESSTKRSFLKRKDKEDKELSDSSDIKVETIENFHDVRND